MSDHASIVVDFINAWMERDVDKIMSFFVEDCIYHNIPMEAAQGLDAVRAMIKSFVDMAEKIEWTIHHIGESSDGVVLTERTDRFLIGENWIALQVMGVFEFSGDKISVWRDYFDLGMFQKELAGG
jgi:limonene-1,2-epoxide hydrolase